MASVHSLRRPSAETPDEELVAGARGGDRVAEEALFKRHLGVVYGLAFKLVGPADCKDVAQDTFVQAFVALESLREPAAFRTWLCGITVRMARRRLRRRKLFGRFFQAPAEPDKLNQVLAVSLPADIAVELKELYAHLASYPSKAREAFILHRMEGMTNEETAKAMGASVSSVKRWLQEVDARLKKSNQRGAI